MRYKIRFELFLAGIGILCVALRLLYIYQSVDTPLLYALAADSKAYDSFARLLLDGAAARRDFLFLNPLYPFFLVVIYALCGYSHLAVVLVQAAIDTASCMLLFFIGSAVFNKKTGIVAACIYGCYGTVIFYTGILLVPIVVIFLMLLSFAALILAERNARHWFFFAAGFLLGVASLGMPNILLVFFVLTLFLLLPVKKQISLRIKAGIFFIAGFALVFSLITLRNSSIEGGFSPFSVLGGLNFYIGNNPQATGGFQLPAGISSSPIEQFKTAISYAEHATGRTLTPSQASRYWLMRGLEFIQGHPYDVIRLYLKKTAFFWRKEEIPINIDYSFCRTLIPLLRLPLFSFGLLAPLGILGTLLALRRRASLGLALVILSYMISVLVFFINDRYRLPVVPFLILAASWCLCWMTDRLQQGAVKTIAVTVFFLLLLGCGINYNFQFFTAAPSPELHLNLGKAYIEMGNPEKALDAFQKAVSIDPKNAGAYHSLGTAYENKGELDAALQHYKKALSLQNDFVAAHFSLGRVYEKKGDMRQALKYFLEAVRQDATYEASLVNRGKLLGSSGRTDDAIMVFEQVLAVSSDPRVKAVTHVNLAIAYYYRRAYHKAIMHADRATALGGMVDPGLLQRLETYR